MYRVQVLNILSPYTCLKCEWYMCAYTRKSLLKIVLVTSMKFGGKGHPNCWGKTVSLSICKGEGVCEYLETS